MTQEKPVIMDGNAVANRRLSRLAKASAPHTLGIVVATNDAATNSYVSRKRELAERIGWQCRITKLPTTAAQPDIIEAIQGFNRDRTIDGLIVQLPLPKGVNPELVFATVDPRKDADGLHPNNLQALYDGNPHIIPATPRGILELLAAYDLPVSGRKVTVVGQGRLTGHPLSALLEQRGAKVTRADRSTKNLAETTRAADILVVATGNPGLITADMVGKNAVVVDVGINRMKDGVTGDVDFDSVKPKVSAITPVPGGVGPMTVVSLLENVHDLAKN